MKTVKIILALIWVILLVIPDRGAYASVDLLYFLGIPGVDSILLIWETATEVDNAGFYVRKSTDPLGSFLRISDYIPSAGDPFAGAYYDFLDSDVVQGVQYYYNLEIIGTDGSSEISNTISVTLIVNTATPTRTISPQSTSTSTATATRTVTRTPTQVITSTGTIASTLTRTPTATASLTYGIPVIPMVGSITPTATITLTPVHTSTASPTTTLLPLSVGGAVFPANTPGNEVTLAPMSATPDEGMPVQTPRGGQAQGIGGFVPILILVIVIWLVLMVFAFLYIRQISSKDE